MELKFTTQFVGAACNLTHNCLAISQHYIIFGSNYAIAVYNIQKGKVLSTIVQHSGRVNCIRFVKGSNFSLLLSAGADGQFIIWETSIPNNGLETKDDSLKDEFLIRPKLCHSSMDKKSILVCDGISFGDIVYFAYITSSSQVFLGSAKAGDDTLQIFQELNLLQSIALDAIFQDVNPEELLLVLGMDSGEVILYEMELSGSPVTAIQAVKVGSLKKHDDWVRCLAFTKLENGDCLLATGGEDSLIAVWKIASSQTSDTDEFEFQIVKLRNSKLIFDSLIIGHEGWINSLQWSAKGELISCSSDQTIIIWENVGEIWLEKVRLGSVGGQLPGGFCARFNENYVAVSGFHGAIQLWSKNSYSEEWNIEPSITGHFKAVSDLDYHPDGHYLVTTSEDQTTRVFGPWGDLNRWHEVSRPQVHGHDIFAVKCSGDYIVSGAEEKILRVFQPTESFRNAFEDFSGSSLCLSNAAYGVHNATVPALGLSNQYEENKNGSEEEETNTEKLDETYLISKTLWPEKSKLYGHGYEICTIGTSRRDPIIVSGSFSSTPHTSTILLWSTKSWKMIGEFPFHKLNVTSLEFSRNGDCLLSASRDRTWALWKVVNASDQSDFSLELIENGGGHTRGLSVATWSSTGQYFVTGARDKKLIIWKSTEVMSKYEKVHVQQFQSPITAGAINGSDLIAVGLELGQILIWKLDFAGYGGSDAVKFQCILSLNQTEAHHDVVRRLMFNPVRNNELVSASSDRIVKIFKLIDI